MNSTTALLTPIAACALLSAALPPASAEAQDLDACNRFDFTSGASCEVRVEGGCMAYCEPPRLVAACSAELYAECSGQCDASLEASCTASCEADCSAECDVSPPEFECSGYCEAECEGSCEAECGAGEGGAECRASCRATCSGECDASCERTPGEASCEARCEASCAGQCQAEANLDCQVDCQADGFVQCEADLQGGCEAQCTRPEGALFCDGQYVDASDIDACIQALRERLNIDVQAEGSADFQCDGGTCEATAEGSVSGCSAGGAQAGGSALLTLLALALWLPLRQRV